MEDYIGNGRNVHHRQHHRHENHSHHHLYNHNQSSQWSLSHDPNTTTNNTHFASFDPPPSSSLSFALNNHHHTHHNDSFVADSSFITMDTKPSQPLYFPATDIFPSSHQSSESLSLKLGKRLYDEGSNSVGSEIKPFTVEVPNVQDFSLVKRGKELFVPGYYQQPPLLMSSPSAVAGSPVPRCQVEGCNVGLMEAKEYHRRHKVCEMHSKAPKVIVQGLEQRFCQQCSRFHVISEFDDSKRSCRRRLAGHNERRRKNSSDSAAKNHLQEALVTGGRFQLANSTSTPAGCALSLLSSEISPTWASSPDLSSRSRAALRELIAENRAAALAKRLVLPDADSVLLVSSPNAHVPYLHQQQFLLAQALQACSRPGSSSLHAFEHMPAETLDLMRGTHAHLGPAAHLLSARSGGHTSAGTNGEDEECEI